MFEDGVKDTDVEDMEMSHISLASASESFIAARKRYQELQTEANRAKAAMEMAFKKMEDILAEKKSGQMNIF